MSVAGQRHPRRRTLVAPLSLLLGTSAVVFIGFYFLDWMVGHQEKNLFTLLFTFDVDTLQNALGNMAQVVAAILGIVITVVSIVVQLAATRYTPRIADMFFRDRTNLGVLAFFVVACINAVWVSISVEKEFVPRISIIVTMGFVTASLLMMVPYFAYVFDFLDPDRVVGRIQEQAVASAAGEGLGMLVTDVETRQRRTLVGVEQLSDIAVNAVSQKDKAIAAGSVNSIKDLLVTYFEKKRGIPGEWFAIGEELRSNPDFVALAADSVDDLAKRKVWLEWKALRQYQSIYNESLGEMPEINNLIAINTRYIGEAALRAEDRESVGLAVKFFNTFMRATLNKQQVRTAYNVLNQYRQLAERALDGKQHALVGEVAFYLKYYGQLAHSMDLGFVTETVAYDLAALCEHAFTDHQPAHDAVLARLLELDKEAESVEQEHTLRGVRKAQAKLASFYLSAVGDLKTEGEAKARQIYEDMREERPERLRSIRDELLKIESKDFWEVIDRGTNFDYLDGARKAQLKVFFSWFPSLSIKETVSA
jgi:hypothetical protein